jgi:hypothetical protein
MNDNKRWLVVFVLRPRTAFGKSYFGNVTVEATTEDEADSKSFYGHILPLMSEKQLPICEITRMHPIDKEAP